LSSKILFLLQQSELEKVHTPFGIQVGSGVGILGLYVGVVGVDVIVGVVVIVGVGV
jgi:hypothetical protein